MGVRRIRERAHETGSMVKAISIEDRLLTEHHEGLQRKTTFETGLIIAQLGVKVDTILRFVPTPEDEDDGKPGVLDMEWLLQHANQVCNMLPGGIGIVGCYACATGAKLQPLEAKLQQVLVGLAKRLPATVSERQTALLLLPCDSKKSACRVLPAGASRLQPVEIKPTRDAPQARTKP